MSFDTAAQPALQEICQDILLKKYAKGDEKTVADVTSRVARGFAKYEASLGHDEEAWYNVFFRHFNESGVGAGRIMSVIGTDIGATAINCFSGDTVALTSDGPLSLKALENKTSNVLTLDGWKPATFKSFGKQTLFEVLFSNGQVNYCTAGHDWIVQKSKNPGEIIKYLEKVKTTDLLGRRVPVIPVNVRPEKNDDYNRGVVHGIIYGDGSKLIRSDVAFYIYLFGNKQTLSNYLAPYSEKVTLSDAYDQPSTRVHGVKLGETDLKGLPTNEHSASYWYGFISGFIATDGCVTNVGASTMVFQNNENDIIEIAKKCIKIGMGVVSVKTYRKLSPFDNTYKPLYMLRFTKSLLSGEDFIRFDQRHTFTSTNNYTRATTLEVVSVKATDRFEEVYCAVEPDTHSFVIEGGILTGNCFVQPLGDSLYYDLPDGTPSIYTAIAQAGHTMSLGGGEGYNFTVIRPRGSLVKSKQATASGPCSYIDVFYMSSSTVESAGSRRGANMGVLDITHPDIEEFVTAKHVKGRWDHFNVSVGVTDAFMNAVTDDQPWQLWHEAKPGAEQIANGAFQRDDGKWVYKTIQATALWKLILESTYNFAEPGILFLDQINRENNLYYCEYINATNPCGEQALPAYGCCDLGPLILTRFVKNPFTKQASFDFDRFASAVAIHVRMLDDVLDITLWPLPQQQAESAKKRRIGAGYTGVGSMFFKLGLRYGSEEALKLHEKINEVMRDYAYNASIDLAIERGAFPAFDVDKYLESAFVKRLPDGLKKRIRKHGIRNSHLLSIAPTGTVSMAFANNDSNGIEPAFSLTYRRRVRNPDETWTYYPGVDDSAFREYMDIIDADWSGVDGIKPSEIVRSQLDEGVSPTAALGPEWITAMELPVDGHLAHLFITQPYIDSAISKTVNIPVDYPFAEFESVYMKAWRGGLKGVATYRPNAARAPVLIVNEKKETPVPVEAPASANEDLLRKPIEKRQPGDLASVTTQALMTINYEERKIYLVTSFHPITGMVDGKKETIMRPIEFFVPQSQVDESPQWVTATMRTLSLLARSGGSVAKALSDYRNIRWDKGSIKSGTLTKGDGSVAPLFHISDVAAIGYVLQQALIRHGYLNEDGTEKTVKELIALNKQTLSDAPPPSAEMVVSEKVKVSTSQFTSGSGKECPNCHAHDYHKRDGCWICENCGHMGSCG